MDMDKVVEGCRATRDEMSYSDWQQRLARAEKEAAAGKAVSLDAYARRRMLRR